LLRPGVWTEECARQGGAYCEQSELRHVGSPQTKKGTRPEPCARYHAASYIKLSCQYGMTYFGCMRIAPSRRIVSPLSMTFSMMLLASCAYSAGMPRRGGN